MARGRRGWGAIRQLPSGRYQARFIDPDSGALTNAGRTFTTKRAADGWLAAKRAELDAGVAVDEAAGKRPLREWWPGYLRSLESRKELTRAGYETAWRLRVEPRFGSTPVRRIKPSQIDEWVADLLASGLSTSKVSAALGVLRRVLDRAVRDRVLASNPCTLRTVVLPKKAAADRPVLTPADVERLAQAMAHDIDRVLVRLLAYGGLRIGEALALQWLDINLNDGTVHVRRSVGEVNGRVVGGSTKTYATRTVVLPQALVQQFKSAATATSTELIFPSRTGNYRRYGNFRRDVWDPACRRTGISALPHDLRATCASLLIDAGASPKDVQMHLGHEDVETTMRLYVRVRPGRNLDIAARLDSLISEVPEIDDDKRPSLASDATR